MLKDTRWEYEPWRQYRPYRLKTPYDSFAFSALYLIAGTIAAFLWLTPVIWGMQQSLPYLYRFFENLY